MIDYSTYQVITILLMWASFERHILIVLIIIDSWAQNGKGSSFITYQTVFQQVQLLFQVNVVEFRYFFRTVF